MQVQLRRFNSMERSPRMLKDFLSENLSSCSSSGFKSFPRKPNNSTMQSLIEMELKSSSNSAFQTLMNTIRSISFFTSFRKSPSMLSLPRSLSRKLSSSSSRKRRNQSFKGGNEINLKTVKIKDIIRWKSFRDIVEEHHQHQPSLPPPQISPLDFPFCMMGSTTTTATTTTTTTTTTCCSSDSSWSESDFFTSAWEAQNDNVEDVEESKKFSFLPLVVGKDCRATEVLTCQKDEQNSPVSVLQAGEDEFSLFDQSLANIQRRKQKFMQTIEKFESLAKFDIANLDQCLSLNENSGCDEEYEDDDDDNDDIEVEEQDWIEERAKQLLHCVKARASVQGCLVDTLLLDFFREELTASRNQNLNNEEFEWEILRIAEDWINGSFSYDIGHANKDAYIKDMDKRCQWSRFEEERKELAFEIETTILHSLVADLLDLDG